MSAEDKSTKKKNQITITNDKGRLSKDDIDRMVAEAEKFKAEDDAVREKVEAKNHFEGYVFNLKNTLNDPSIAEKIDASDKSMVEKSVEDAQLWLDSLHGEVVSKDEYEKQQKKVESIVNPIISKLYQSGNAGNSFPTAGHATGGHPFPGSCYSSKIPRNEEKMND